MRNFRYWLSDGGWAVVLIVSIGLLGYSNRSAIASGIQALATVAAGGTGLTTLTAHDVLIGNGTSPVNLAGPGTAGQCFVSNGAGADPTYQTCNGTSVSSTTPVTVNANSTMDQNLMSLSLPAGFLNSTTRPFMFDGAGVFTTQVGQTPTLTFKIKLCTVSGCGSGTVVTLVSIVTTATVASITNNNWNIRVIGYTAATGAMGNLEIHGPVTVDLGALTTTADAVFGDTNTAVSGNIDLTAALFVQFTVTFSTNAVTANIGTQRAGGVLPWDATTAGGGGTPAGSTGQWQYNNAGAFGALTGTSSIPTAGWTIINAAQFNNFSNAFLSIRAADSASNNIRGVTRALPGGTTYTVAWTIRCSIDKPQTSAQACQAGLSDGTIYQNYEILGQVGTALTLRVQNWTNITTAGTTPFGPTINLTTETGSFCVTENNTNRTWFHYSNGAWVQDLQLATGTTLTPTVLYFGAISTLNNVSQDAQTELLFLYTSTSAACP